MITASSFQSCFSIECRFLEEDLITRKRQRRRGQLIPVDLAMKHTELISPAIKGPNDDYGDPETAIEVATRNHEGRLRHGFRELLEELEST